MKSQLIIQFLTIVFLILFSISYQAKSRKKILAFQIMGLLSLALHFLLLNAWSGLAMITIHIVMLLIFINKDANVYLTSKTILYAFILTYIIFTVITWQGYFSLFALLGISSAACAKWQSNPMHIKVIGIPTGIFWIMYDFYILSYGGILVESIILLSIFYSLVFTKYYPPSTNKNYIN